MMKCLNAAFGLLLLVLLQACSSNALAPVDKRKVIINESPASVTERGRYTNQSSSPAKSDNKSGFHIVTKGETLYSIAWRYDKDFKEVARWNDIRPPYMIYPEQLIRLKPRPGQKPTTKKAENLRIQTVTDNARQPKSTPAKQALVKPTKPAMQKKPRPANKPVLPKGPVAWHWPTAGNIVNSNSPKLKKGINISGKPGQSIKAAAAGQVVYSGSGLFGYGKLIIIKHNETYLSAYAYNSKLLVKEGDTVKSGQTISFMGQDHSGRTLLHFEIRKNGKPINPTSYLPKKRA